ncbi:MAG: hypothetical protein BWY70_00375 [Bacteroidetes bacterium ADurb.Bin408]|nr:MAG: hypothetical protein BWY70_00375 [Bacteroidetes bacterium ADurb.Bin408]
MTSFPNIRIQLITGIFLINILSVCAQTNIRSPYSRYGLGQINSNYSIKAMSMGGMCLANSNNDFINISNPATYSAFDTTSFIFEGGINGIFAQMRNQTTSVYTSNLSLNYLLFGFPVSKRFACSFGLLPFSNIGYSITDSAQITDIGDIKYFFKGEGGFNKVYGGASVKLIKGLSVGFNTSYLFGSLNKIRTITFPESVNMYSIREANETKVSDVILDYGLLYEKKFKNNNCLSVGLITGLKSKLNAKEYILTESFSGLTYGSTYIKDTLENSAQKGDIVLPPYIGGGITFKKNNKWLIGVDYKTQKWNEFSSFGHVDSLSNSMQASVGMSFFPSNPSGTSFWNKTTYRFGLRYAQTYLQLRNSQLNEYGISFGFAFPMQRSKSTINFGVELGQRGTTENNLIKETFALVSCSLSIYERWFIKRKYE